MYTGTTRTVLGELSPGFLFYIKGFDKIFLSIYIFTLSVKIKSKWQHLLGHIHEAAAISKYIKYS